MSANVRESVLKKLRVLVTSQTLYDSADISENIRKVLRD